MELVHARCHLWYHNIQDGLVPPPGVLGVQVGHQLEDKVVGGLPVLGAGADSGKEPVPVGDGSNHTHLSEPLRLVHVELDTFWGPALASLVSQVEDAGVDVEDLEALVQETYVLLCRILPLQLRLLEVGSLLEEVDVLVRESFDLLQVRVKSGAGNIQQALIQQQEQISIVRN